MWRGGYPHVVVKHSACPPRYNGAVAFYKAGGSVPTSRKELANTKPLTRSREILTFKDAQPSQMLSAALCRENEKGRLGTPSLIQTRVTAEADGKRRGGPAVLPDGGAADAAAVSRPVPLTRGNIRFTAPL